MIKLLYRIPLRVLQQLLIVTILVPTGMLLVPLGLFLLRNDLRTNNCAGQRLPKWLSWFDVGDEFDKKYGVNGDLGYQADDYMKRNYVPEEFKALIIQQLGLQTEYGGSKWQLFKMRYIWLAVRNPLNGFKYNVLGAKNSNTAVYTKRIRSVDHEVTDWSNGGAGMFYCEAQFEGDTHWEFYLVYQYPFKKNKCLRLRFGHKIGQNLNNNDRSIISWSCAIQPWKTYRGL